MRKTFRATYSQKGLDWLHPQYPYRTGDAYLSKKYTYIRWDGNQTFSAYAKEFIQEFKSDDCVNIIHNILTKADSYASAYKSANDSEGSEICQSFRENLRTYINTQIMELTRK